MSNSPTAHISKLPFELLSHIYAHLPTAQSVRNLSLTCKFLHDFTRKEGWKVFTRERFPSIQVPTDLENYASVAHGLTTLSRNWDRRAILARHIEPSGYIVDGTSGAEIRQWRTNSGQTMGYQPSIDSYEEWLGGPNKAQKSEWSSRRQVLAWSAGSELIIRLQTTGAQSRPSHLDGKREDLHPHFDDYRRLTHWFTWRHQGSRDGRDDITSVKLIKPQLRKEHFSTGEHILVGTASGRLDLISGDNETNRFRPAATYNTTDQAVRSTDISTSTSSPLVIAGLDDAKIALYPLTGATESQTISSCSEFTAITEEGRDRRVWSTKFLSPNRVALGLGPSAHPLQVFQVTPSGIDTSPIGRFGLDGINWAVSSRVEAGRQAWTKQSSVYPICPLPAMFDAGEATGNVFLSGWYDGIIRLHDMRTPSTYVSTYSDPTDDSPIFSLQTIGAERVVAGSARYCKLKVFDLRAAGCRRYHYLDVQPSHPQTETAASTSSDNWNVFITPPHWIPAQSRMRSQYSSPIYSISNPSGASPTLFAGLENAVVQLDFVSMLDSHPDSLYSDTICRVKPGGDIDIKRTWNRGGKVLNLAMYNQTPNEMRLLVQRGVGKYYHGTGERDKNRNLDERWVWAKFSGLRRG